MLTNNKLCRLKGSTETDWPVGRKLYWYRKRRGHDW